MMAAEPFSGPLHASAQTRLPTPPADASSAKVPATPLSASSATLPAAPFSTSSTTHLAAPRVGRLAAGALDAISDVPGVTVGHATLMANAVQTGVTVIRPHAGDVFRNKVPAAAVVFNGFGKSIGLMQLEEMGVLETPIALTNTLCVAAVAIGQTKAAIQDNPEIGRTLPTVNPLVFECNDGYLNDIQAMAIGPEHYHAALKSSAAVFEQGAIGAGRGMSCFELKGGIGSSSRLVQIAGAGKSESAEATQFCVGALVLANFGKLEQMIIAGRPLSLWLAQSQADSALHPQVHAHGPATSTSAAMANVNSAGVQGAAETAPANPNANANANANAKATLGADASNTSNAELGSIIMIVATDAPLDARQLRRLAMRCGIGLARTGSNYGHGSGDLALAFSTAQTVAHSADDISRTGESLHEFLLDPLFQAVAESTEQAILNALYAAESVTGFGAHRRTALRELLNKNCP